MPIKIELNKPDSRYIAGEVLQATVNIDSEEPQKVRCVYIVVRGEAEVRWSERHSHTVNGKTQHRTVTYSSTEQYLNSETVLFGAMDGPTVMFPSGAHTYNIACALPDRLPGTVRTNVAHISYKVKVVMDIPWGIDTTESKAFEIVNVVDLNQNQMLKMPVQMEEVKSFCFFSCSPHEALITVTVPRGGFVPNETIPIQCRIDNKTSVDFTGASFVLQRTVTAVAVTPLRKVRETKDDLALEERTLESNTKNKVTELTAELKVPVCPVSCHLAAYITTDYCVKAEFWVSGCHANVSVRIPIQIGTIPLGGPSFVASEVVPLAPMPNAPPADPAAPSAPIPDGDVDKLAPSEVPPPSYADVTSNEKTPLSSAGGIGWNVN